MTEIKRSAMNGIKFDAVRSCNVAGPESTVVEIISPYARYEAVLLRCREIAVIHIEPVFFNGCLLCGVKVNSLIADGFVSGNCSPMNERRVELHTFGS